MLFAAPAQDRLWHEPAVLCVRANVCSWGKSGRAAVITAMTDFEPQAVFGSSHRTCLSPLVTDHAVGSVVSSSHCVNDPQSEGHMASYLGRRKFLATLGGAAAAWPLAARAQQAERVRRVGVLMPMGADSPVGQARLAAFLQGLQQFGWAVGRNLRIDLRWAAARLTAIASTRRNWWRSRPTSS